MSTYYGPKELENWMMAIWEPKQWLHSDWSKEKQEVFNELYNFQVPFTGYSPFRDQFDTILDNDFDSRYMGRYGIGFSDVYDPRKLKSSSHGTFGTALNFVSSNVKRLYR